MRAASFASLCAAVVLLGTSAEAAAQEWGGPRSPDASDGPSDPLVPTAIAETGTGVLIGAVGAAMLVDANSGDEERCGRIAGCVDAVQDIGADLDGRYVAGAGIGLAAAGGLTWAIAQGAPLERGEERDSNGGTIAGSLLVSLGASGVGSIIAGSTSEAHETGYDVLIGLAAVPSLAVGIPLLATSADGESSAEREAEQAQARAPREPGTVASPAMFATGVTLTAIGGLGAVSGTAIIASSDGDIGQGLGGLVVLGSLLFLGPGIPLTIVGGRDAPARATEAAVPVVHVGPGSVELTGRF